MSYLDFILLNSFVAFVICSRYWFILIKRKCIYFYVFLNNSFISKVLNKSMNVGQRLMKKTTHLAKKGVVCELNLVC